MNPSRPATAFACGKELLHLMRVFGPPLGRPCDHLSLGICAALLIATAWASIQAGRTAYVREAKVFRNDNKARE